MSKRTNSSNGNTIEADAPTNETPADVMKRLDEDYPDSAETSIVERKLDIDAPVESEPDPGVLAFRQEVIDAGPDFVFNIDPIEIIVDNARNGRVEERKASDKDVKDLAEDIKRQGQMMPGEVHLDMDGKIYLTYGFGRMAAIQLINSTRSVSDRLPFKTFIKLDVSPSDARSRNFAENHQRKELTVLDRSKVVADYLTDGMKQNEIAERTGLSRATVSNYAKISGPLFTPKVKEYIKAGQISQRGAVELCALKTSEEIEKAADELVKSAGPTGRVSVSATKKKTRVNVAPSASKQRTAKEIVDVLDFIFQKQNVKTLAKSTEEICRVFADIVMGRTSQEKALAKLALYQ